MMGLLEKTSQLNVIKQGSERLTRYWSSVDNDLKKIAGIMNENFPAIGEGITGLEEKIDNLEKKIDQLLEVK